MTWDGVLFEKDNLEMLFAPVDGFGVLVLVLGFGVSAGVVSSGVSGLSLCRVAAFGLSGLRKLD
ncbi:MAG TPA: hypothetical protein VKJ77_13190, partial [Caballeronia sp.]|nr:hypothetical protein [Caballeronia sp.]